MIFKWFRHRRRARLQAAEFPASDESILLEGFPLYRCLPKSLREKLQNHIKVFLDEKHFEGCMGFELTQEVKLLIAAQACLLLLGKENTEYTTLKSILVYPDTYQAKRTEMAPGGVVTETQQAVLGQSWERGTVALSWKSTQRGAANMHDGRNVVLHEFAHQLDQATGQANGLPKLRSASRYAAWKRVMSEEYERLQDRVEAGRRTVMDAYGATHPAEFFAVASECFFEKPEQLKRARPALYDQLQLFYQQDPSAYLKG